MAQYPRYQSPLVMQALDLRVLAVIRLPQLRHRGAQI
jgi:hypothetical protein